mmetsp:Transcript_103891/g.260554  ORF Transcript_103891/g.260554 Transcript_103891/m.260554 type:complete len:304 (-) Transcript_103891:16-927(-)
MPMPRVQKTVPSAEPKGFSVRLPGVWLLLGLFSSVLPGREAAMILQELVGVLYLGGLLLKHLQRLQGCHLPALREGARHGRESDLGQEVSGLVQPLDGLCNRLLDGDLLLGRGFTVGLPRRGPLRRIGIHSCVQSFGGEVCEAGEEVLFMVRGVVHTLAIQLAIRDPGLPEGLGRPCQSLDGVGRRGFSCNHRCTSTCGFGSCRRLRLRPASDRDVGGLGLAAPVVLGDVEGHLDACVQVVRFTIVHLRDVEEDVTRAVFVLDEAEALVVHELLHGSGEGHFFVFFQRRARREDGPTGAGERP